MGAGPIRTCVGCRRAAPKEELLRVTQAEAGGLLFDLAQEAPGRGAYLCMSASCLIQALKKGGVGRAFRRPLRYVDPRDAARSLAEALRQEAAFVLARGARSAAAIELGAPWGKAPTEAHAWRVARWLALAYELEANPPPLVQQSRKKRGEGAEPTSPRHEGREDGETGVRDRPRDGAR
jgi:predicted RNA-binding protein YlxR (DUF448 family)